MQKKALIKQAEQIMKRYACRGLSGEERVEMQGMVERFFAERAGHVSQSEIMEHMATPMKALAWFNPFLCQTFWEHCCNSVLPQDESACQLTGYP